MRERDKTLMNEVKTLYSYTSTLAEKINKGSIKEIRRWCDKVEAQSKWINILCGEVYNK